MDVGNSNPGDPDELLTRNQLEFLATLPLLLNSSLSFERVIATALMHIKQQLDAEAATLFLLIEGTRELGFWALTGNDQSQLKNKRIPADKGIVGWVIANTTSALVNDVARDIRFFKKVDSETGFKTKSMVCAPVVVRGTTLLGAIQVLNKNGGVDFRQSDLAFIEKFAHHVALAIENARLLRTAHEQALKLEALDKKKNDIITVIAHEFRTPLTLIQTSAEMITAATLSQDQKARIHQTLTNGVERLTKLVTEVRNVAVVKDDSLDIQRTQVLVSQLIVELQQEFDAIIRGRELHFTVEQTRKDLVVNADYVLLLLALRNLIANAIRFTPNGGKIVLSFSESAGFVEIAVADTGIGIAEDQTSAIFEKFYEVAHSMDHSSGRYEFRSGGLGLGLSTVRSIVRAHGSEVNVSSALGQGSRFSFFISVE